MGFDPKHFWHCSGTKLFLQRSAIVTIGCSGCCLIIGTHASGISIVLSSEDVISLFGWSILRKFFVEAIRYIPACCLSLVRRRGDSELLPSPPWITSKCLSYYLQTKRLFLKFICGHFQVVLTCTSSLTLPWQPSFDSHVCQNVYLLH